MMQLISQISEWISLFANLCVLFLTVYTLYLTAFSRKLRFVSMGCGLSRFLGDTIHLHLQNTSLHSIPVTKVFLLKRINGEFYSITLADYKDEPLVIDAWHIARIQTIPFTRIEDPSTSNELPGLSDIHRDAVIAVEMGNRIIWIRPYKRAPYRSARKAYQKGRFEILTVFRNDYNGVILSDAVNYVIHILQWDINNQKSVKTVFAIAGKDGADFSESICGCTRIEDEDCHNAKKMKHCLCHTFDIPEENIVVRKVRSF